MTYELQSIIETAFEDRQNITPATGHSDVRDAVQETIELLNSGQARVAEKIAGEWVVHQWLKKAVLLYFRLHDNAPMDDGITQYYDKVPLKYANYSAERFAQESTRVVPSAIVRTGSFIAKNVVLMPSYVNIGAYVDQSTMVDTWADCGVMRSDRQKCSPFRWCRHRRSPRAPAGQPNNY